MRWIVAPYGERSWVKNARVAGWVDLDRAGRTTRATLAEVEPREAAPVLRAYLRSTAVTRGYFDVSPDSPLAAFEAEAVRHPVFRVTRDI